MARRLLRGGDGWAMAALVMLPFLWYAIPLFTDQVCFIGDLLQQYYPWWAYAGDSLREGRFPLWNPYVLGGMPFHANPDNALFYPLRIPLVFLSFFKGVVLLRVLNTLVASFGMYWLLRHWRTRSLSAFLGAVLFSYGSFMAYQFVHVTYVNTAAWFPWQLLCLQRLFRLPTLRVTVSLALVTAAAFLGGAMSIFLVGHIALLVFAGFAAIERFAGGQRRGVLQAVGHLFVSVLLVLALTAVLLLPALEFAGLSTRMNPTAYQDQVSGFSVAGRTLLTLLFPFHHFLYGAPYPPVYRVEFVHIPYVGVAGVLLALMNLVLRRHARLLPPAVVVIGFGILMSMGTNTAFLPWMFGCFPPFQWFRWPHDYLFLCYAVLAILAAAGFDVLLRDGFRRRGAVGVLVGAYVIAGLVCIPAGSSVVLSAIVALAVAMVAVGLLVSYGARRLQVAIALCLLVLAELFWFSGGYRLHLSRPSVGMEQVSDVIKQLRAASTGGRVSVAAVNPEYCRGQQEVFFDAIRLPGELPASVKAGINTRAWLRRAGANDVDKRLAERDTGSGYSHLRDDVVYYPVNAAMLLRYEEMCGYDPFALGRVSSAFARIPMGQLWNLFNVTHVITPNRIISDQLVALATTNGLYAWVNQSAYPRVMIPEAVCSGLAPDQVLSLMESPSFDPTRTVLLEASVSDGWTLPTNASRVVEESAGVRSADPERVVVSVKLGRPGILVLHDVYYPGWKAFVDGRVTPILRANYLFRAVVLPAGVHSVEFRYEPSIFRYSAAVSAVSWVVCLVLLFWAGSGRRVGGVHANA